MKNNYSVQCSELVPNLIKFSVVYLFVKVLKTESQSNFSDITVVARFLPRCLLCDRVGNCLLSVVTGRQ